jgi:hypothetical protein
MYFVWSISNTIKTNKQMSYKHYLLNGILAATVGFGLSSCGVMRPAGKQVTRTSSYRTAAIQTSKVVADLEIDQEKKSDKATDKASASIDALKGMAVHNVLSANKGDILLEPTFVVENNGLTITVTVTGYVAKYVNLRQVKDGELKVNVAHPGKTASVQPDKPNAKQPQKKRRFGLNIGGL